MTTTVLSGLLASAVVAETFLRLGRISFPSFYDVDEHAGIRLRGGVSGWWRNENKTYIRINSDGFRDKEHAVQKPARTTRIAVVGNSFCEAMQVPLEDTFWAIAERELNKTQATSGWSVEVLNFGVSNFTTAEELITLRQSVWKYSPDVVILAFLTATDVLGNAFALKRDSTKPYFVRRQGKLTPDNRFRENRAFRLKRTVAARVYYRCYDHVRIVQVLNELKNRLLKALRGNPYVLPDNARDVYRDPVDDRWREAWDVTEMLIRQMRVETIERGAYFLLVTLDNPIQVNPSRTVRDRYAERHGIQTVLYPDLRLRDFAERADIPALILAPALQQYAEDHKTYLHGFGAQSSEDSGNEFDMTLGRGHWNQLGHAVVGQMIAQKLAHDVLPQLSKASGRHQ